MKRPISRATTETKMKKKKMEMGIPKYRISKMVAMRRSKRKSKNLEKQSNPSSPSVAKQSPVYGEANELVHRIQK